MVDDPERMLDTARHHVGRAAYHTRDNPYLRAQATSRLSTPLRRALVGILSGEIGGAEWLETRVASDALEGVGAGIVPRDLQLVLREGREQVGVESVHAFANAPLFWWLVSYLWCAEVGRTVDPLLGERIFGYRLHPAFLTDPASSPRVFRSPSTRYDQWRRSAIDVAKEFQGQVIATSTVDLRDFYYSVQAGPSRIVDAFLATQEGRPQLSRSATSLGVLLDALHDRYRYQEARLSPRGDGLPIGRLPLPVGLPSSQVLANLIVAVALQEISQVESVIGATAYADDLLVLSRLLPDVDEETLLYFERLGIIADVDAEPVLASATARTLAALVVGVDKSETSYSRVTEQPSSSDVFPDEEDLDPYLEARPSGDWGGRLRTVLRSPFRRDRVPRELAKDIRRLADDIRVGLAESDADARLNEILVGMDRGSFLALRPYWTELLAVAWFAGRAEALDGLNRALDDAVASLELPEGANARLRLAVDQGLRASWEQALAEAMAVVRGGLSRSPAELDEALLARAVGVTPAELGSHARELREQRFVLAHLVSVPLAEFTPWRGALFGARSFTRFVRSTSATLDRADPVSLLEGLENAKRFVPLHEACLAVHVWLAPDGRRWARRAFDLLRRQPLVDAAMLADLERAAGKVQRKGRPLDEAAERVEDYVMRVALPSIDVSDKQLDLLIAGDWGRTGEIARQASQDVNAVVRAAERGHADVLVLPEWTVPAPQLPWIFERSAKHQMLIVAGEAPSVVGGVYSNRVWTGIPFADSAGHVACLIPRPRDKRHLSPEESAAVNRAGLARAAGGAPKVFHWKGVNFASLVCYEFADISAREQLRETADVLTVSSLNRDWRYFDAVQEATTRDNYCLTVCVNVGRYPGTRIMRPTKSENAVAASVHGSSHPTVVTRIIDLLPIVLARARVVRPSAAEGFPAPRDDTELSDYKALPPTFG